MFEKLSVFGAYQARESVVGEAAGPDGTGPTGHRQVWRSYFQLDECVIDTFQAGREKI